MVEPGLEGKVADVARHFGALLTSRADILLVEKSFRTSANAVRVLVLARQLAYPVAMPSRNMMLLCVFLSLFKSSSIASTGGTPVSARRRMTTLLYSSGW